MPSTSTLTSRTPKAVRVPKPRIERRKSWAKFALFWAKTPGTRLSGSSKPIVGSPSWISERSMTLTAAGTSAREVLLRVAVTTMGSSSVGLNGWVWVLGVSEDGGEPVL